MSKIFLVKRDAFLQGPSAESIWPYAMLLYENASHNGRKLRLSFWSGSNSGCETVVKMVQVIYVTL